MKTFEKLIKELDQFVLAGKVCGCEVMRYTPMYFGELTGHVLAGVQILLPPTYDLEGRLLFISTQMKVWFGEIDTAIDAIECAVLGIPEEHPNEARDGVYGGFRVVGQKGFQNLLLMATDAAVLRNSMIESMPLGIESLGPRASCDLEREYDLI